MYVQSKWISADKSIEILKKYHTFLLDGKRTGTRKQKENMTSEKQQEVNRRHREEKLMMLIKDNFPPGSWYLTVTYRQRPNVDEVPEDMRTFTKKIRYRMKKAGREFKWLGVKENLSGKGRPHFHLLMTEEFDYQTMRDMVKSIWGKGFVKIEPFGGEIGDASRMAKYFTKQKITDANGRLTSSRNLIRSKPVKKKIKRADTWNRDMKPPAGYEIIKDLSYIGVTRDGYPLQRIVCQKIEERRKPRGKKKTDREVLSKPAAVSGMSAGDGVCREERSKKGCCERAKYAGEISKGQGMKDTARNAKSGTIYSKNGKRTDERK